jgi:hypothetical protein
MAMAFLYYCNALWAAFALKRRKRGVGERKVRTLANILRVCGTVGGDFRVRSGA